MVVHRIVSTFPTQYTPNDLHMTPILNKILNTTFATKPKTIFTTIFILVINVILDEILHSILNAILNTMTIAIVKYSIKYYIYKVLNTLLLVLSISQTFEMSLYTCFHLITAAVGKKVPTRLLFATFIIHYCTKK